LDDTFVVWPHGEEELRKYLDHLNSIHHNIKFTIEVEKNRYLPFLDVLVSRRPDSSLGQNVYREPTHTDLYLHAKSAHLPAQKKGVLLSLIHLARRLCDADSLDKEVQHIKETFKKMATATRISDGLSKERLKPVRSRRSRSLSVGFPTKGPPHTRSVGCWPNSTSRPYIFRTRT
jgi:hypothetical protein